MKFVLFILIVSSFLAALFSYGSAATTWSYFPTSAIGVAFYEHTDWLILFHLVIGVSLIFFWLETQSRKAMVAAFVIFFASILINIGTYYIKSEKVTTVQIDKTYQVSSFEMPTVNYEPPFGFSPFRMHSRLESGEVRISSLHFAPKQQFDFEAIFEDESAEKFFVAIYTLYPDELDESVKRDNLAIIQRHKYGFEIYPEEEFEAESSSEKFEIFIENNLAAIEQDIAARTVANSDAP